MHIVSLEECDIDSIVAIEKEAMAGLAWSKELFMAELKDKTKFYIVAKNEETVLGYGGFQQILDEAHIMNIAVERTNRRKGYGKAILNALLELADSLSINAVTLEVSELNTTAIALYEAFGFKYSGTRPNYYGKGIGARIYWRYFN